MRRHNVQLECSDATTKATSTHVAEIARKSEKMDFTLNVTFYLWYLLSDALLLDTPFQILDKSIPLPCLPNPLER